jgi:hypothetical protein
MIGNPFEAYHPYHEACLSIDTLLRPGATTHQLEFRQFQDQAAFYHKEHKNHEEKTQKTLRALRICGEISCVLLKKAKLQSPTTPTDTTQ